ncbi:PREDICTED: interferon alpha/beta receptor 1 isoform X1 [Ficedula albicollis]|uniref:interferon alpha/beta receptor 1 isoform X1 n=1 Tax=Ficedula albicollis TaxID=59894 RepID=UPI00035A2F19|nr:PREDICTED: interferon alpha/beta receptor 1 isoform X1 [Ficedula albicollis]
MLFTGATLGPPRVNRVSASSHSLLISVSPPFPPEHGDSLQYLVSYWENTTSPTRKQELSVVETLFQIGNLKESTVYCFSIQVQLKIISGHLLGEERAPECHRTALSEATRAGLIIALFILALIFVNLLAVALLLLWKHHQKIKFWAQPPLQIPAHFQEFLREPGLEELCSPAEEEPQAMVVAEGNGLEGEGSFTQHLQGQGSL